MNNSQKNINSESRTSYTDPSVPKPSSILPIILTSVFLFLGLLLPMPYNLISFMLGGAFTAKSFSVKCSPLPIIALIPPLILGIFTSLEAAIIPFVPFLSGFISKIESVSSSLRSYAAQTKKSFGFFAAPSAPIRGIRRGFEPPSQHQRHALANAIIA